MAELSTSATARFWRRLAAPLGNRQEQRRFWQSTTPAGRLLFGLGVFALFASLGFLTDVPTLGRSTLGRVILVSLISGGGAIAYAVVAFRDVRWMPLVIGIHILLTVLLPRLMPLKPPVVVDPVAAATLGTRMQLNVVGASLCIAAGYSFFVVFFMREGRRYYRLHTELVLARSIHRELVPPIDVEIGGFEFRGVSLPSGDVGGDLVDVVDHADDAAWTAYVTDVSGHGVPSGVLMGMIKSAMRMALVAPVPLEALLDRLNDVLFELKPPQMYATFAAIRRDGRDELSFTLAGHLPILHWRAESGDVAELSVGQVPLGVLPGRTFEASRVTCAPGDVLLVLTDGLTEVFDADDHEFGMDRVRELLAAHASLPLEEIQGRLLDASRSYGTPHDDQSLILIRRLA